MATIVYANLEKPGYSRISRGRGFSYLGLNGKPLKRRSLIDYCRSLVIPPAWQNVWISPIQHAHILCTGVDDASRKQYRYHPEWTEVRNTRKFRDLQTFGGCLPRLREQIDIDLSAPRFSKNRVIASTVRLIDKGLIRVGNEQYVCENGSRGATTLTARSASVTGNQITLDFKGKSGKQHHLVLEDRALARSISYCQELPGQRLFQYLDEDGKRVQVDSTDVNDYLKAVSGEDFTAKHFRTWGGSVGACEFLHEQQSKAETPASGKSREAAMVKQVAGMLGNTSSVARKYYIHPMLLKAAQRGASFDVPSRALTGLSRSESRFMRVLKQST